MIKRRKTREVKIGDLIIGGEHAITVQSMTTTKTCLLYTSDAADE